MPTERRGVRGRTTTPAKLRARAYAKIRAALELEGEIMSTYRMAVGTSPCYFSEDEIRLCFILAGEPGLAGIVRNLVHIRNKKPHRLDALRRASQHLKEVAAGEGREAFLAKSVVRRVDQRLRQVEAHLAAADELLERAEHGVIIDPADEPEARPALHAVEPPPAAEPVAATG